MAPARAVPEQPKGDPRDGTRLRPGGFKSGNASSSPPQVPVLRTVLSFLWTLPRRLLVGGVRLYQAVLSPHFPPSCRFTPTCSEYAVEAFRRYGAVKGGVLTSWRLLRCAPWGKGGYDPPRWFGEAPPPETPTPEPQTQNRPA